MEKYVEGKITTIRTEETRAHEIVLDAAMTTYYQQLREKVRYAVEQLKGRCETINAGIETAQINIYDLFKANDAIERTVSQEAEISIAKIWDNGSLSKVFRVTIRTETRRRRLCLNPRQGVHDEPPYESYRVRICC